MKPSLLVAQLGARRHYAIPEILNARGMLELLYNDICAVRGWPQYLRLIPPRFRSPAVARLAGRVPRIPRDRIATFSGFGFEYARRLRRSGSSSQSIPIFLWAGKTFGRLILRQGLRGTGIYVFNTAGLELLAAAKRQGLQTILEQTIAPHAIEFRLMNEERELHPGWEHPPGQTAFRQEYMEREQQEWELADRILCGSDFVRVGIEACGGPRERCVVVPYGVGDRFVPSPQPPHPGPLRVLTVGSVGLRKGAPYILEAAKRLQNRAVFRMVGPVGVLPPAISALQEHLELVGPVPRDRILQHYQWADVFLLPSICEGSATAIYEALACGLPVITTPNSGSIVRDGVEGFIVPIRDVESIVERLNLFMEDKTLLATLRHNIRQKNLKNNFDRYGDRLVKAIYSISQMHELWRSP